MNVTVYKNGNKVSESSRLNFVEGSNITFNVSKDVERNQTIIEINSAGGSGITDGNYGDVTVSGGGTVITINNNVVTDAKIASGITASKITEDSTHRFATDAEKTSWNSKLGPGTTSDSITEGATNKYFTELRVLSTILTGLSITGSSVLSSDTILQAIGKLQNQINAVAGGVNYQGNWNASTNSPSITSGIGTKGYYYVVSVPGSTSIDGINDWKLGDWIIFNGSTWAKVDNTDAVVSVNGYTGIVTLTTADVADSTNKRYVTDAEKTVLSNTSGTNSGDETNQRIGNLINSATSKTTPVDADHVGLMDSAASNVQKKLSWANIKATLKTYFDTLYQAVLVSGTNIKTINGSTILGSGDLVVSSGYHFVGTLASNQATGANTTPVSLTGLVFNYAANSKYRIWAMGRVQPTAATTGCGFQFDLSSAVTAIDVQFHHQLANTGTISGGHSIADDASVGVSSGMPGTSTYPVTVEGLLVTGANSGTAQLRFRSETTAVTTAIAGFTLVVEKIA